MCSCPLLQCLTPDKALSVLEDDGKAKFSEDDYQRLSTLLLYYIVNLEDLCSPDAASPSSSSFSSSSSENHQFYVLALASLHPDEDTGFLSSSEIETILQLINQNYHPYNHDASPDLQVRWENVAASRRARALMTISRLIQRCVDAAGLLQDLNAGEDSGVGASSVPKLAAAVVTHILQGHCFRRPGLPYPAFFTDYIFQSLNRTSNLQIMGNCLPVLLVPFWGTPGVNVRFSPA